MDARTALSIGAAALLLASAGLASAHHSSVAFDLTARATLTGTVKNFSWTNPHCWISMMVPDGKGGTEEWNLEGGSVSILVRNGWKIDTIAPGDKIKVLISPRKDKTPGGEFYTVLEKNGEPLQLNVNKSG